MIADTTDAALMADKFAIRELLDAYSQMVNLREWSRIGSLFTEDGAWHVFGIPEPRQIEGNKAVAASIAAAVEKYIMLVQMNHAPLIEVDGDQATAHSTINEIAKLSNEIGVFLLGSYQDEICRVGGSWKFRKRTFRAVYRDTSPLAGKVILAQN